MIKLFFPGMGVSFLNIYSEKLAKKMTPIDPVHVCMFVSWLDDLIKTTDATFSEKGYYVL